MNAEEAKKMIIRLSRQKKNKERLNSFFGLPFVMDDEEKGSQEKKEKKASVNSAYIRGFCKAAEAHGVDPAVLMKSMGGRLSRGIERMGDRVGGAIGSAYQRLMDARSAAKLDNSLNTNALNAYNGAWQQFAKEHSFDNFMKFKQQYLKKKLHRTATGSR